MHTLKNISHIFIMIIDIYIYIYLFVYVYMEVCVLVCICVCDEIYVTHCACVFILPNVYYEIIHKYHVIELVIIIAAAAAVIRLSCDLITFIAEVSKVVVTRGASKYIFRINKSRSKASLKSSHAHWASPIK